MKHYDTMLNVTKAKELQKQAEGMLNNATQLHGNANQLYNNAKGASADSAEALKQKAGDESTPGTLRFFAKELYDAANKLHEVAGSADEGAAQNLKDAVGDKEETNGGQPTTLRQKLKQLAEDAANAGDVTGAYNTVKGKFGEVQRQKQQGKYATGDKQEKYKAVESAWNAFDKVYNADLRQLATNLKNTTDDSSGLQGALKNLNGATGDALIVANAKTVIEKFNAVKDKLDKVKELETTYKAIDETKTHYSNVVSKFTALQQVYDAGANDLSGFRGKAQRLHDEAGTLANQLQGADVAITAAKALVTKLKDAVSKSGEQDKGLEQLLGELHEATDFSDIHDKATQVLAKYNDVANKYDAVKDNEEAKKKGSELGKVTSAFQSLKSDFNNGQWNNISFIYTSRESSHHLTQIQQKAGELKSTAEAQSTIELGHTNQTDLKQGSNHPQDNLADKAGELATKARELNRVAGDLETAASAGSPLATLKEPAGSLKTAAKATSGGTGLDDKILKKTVTLHEKANNLANADGLLAGQQDDPTKQELRRLAEALRDAVGNGSQNKLQQALKDLKGASTYALIVERALTVITKYKEVEDAYEAVTAKESEYQKLANSEYTQVTDAFDDLENKFEALKKSYENFLKFRVQELANLAEKIKASVGTQAGSSPADQLIWYHANQLHGKAGLLASADGVSGKANLTGPLEDLKDAIGENEKAFGKLQQALKALNEASTADQDQKSKAIEVINAYTNVKYAYLEVKNLEEEYKNALDDGNENKYDDVETQFTNLEEKYNGAISGMDPHFWKKWIIKIPSIIAQWLNFLTYVILFFVYRGGCPKPAAASTTADTPITSVKLAISQRAGKVTHTITLNPSGGTNELTYKSDPITLKSGTGTLIIKLPGGEIKLTKLTISSTSLTIGSGSKVSVTKKGQKINLESNATLSTSSGTIKTLTLNKADSGGTDEVQITGSGDTVVLDYGSDGGDITISGNAINDILRKLAPQHSPQYFDVSGNAFKKWSEYTAGHFYLSLSILMVIKITFSAMFIYSLHYGVMWTSVYGFMDHKSTDKILRFGAIGWDSYDTTRNTDLTLSVNLNGTNSNKFASDGTITITVGGNNFTKLGGAPNVTITLSEIGSSIKKYDKDGQPKDFGTGEALAKDTELEIDATGQITTPTGAGDVTIKATVNVTSDNKQLGTSPLTLAPDTDKDPSSTGLGGSITPQGTASSGPVSISGSTSNITLRGKALEALQSLTKNAVNLGSDGRDGFPGWTKSFEYTPFGGTETSTRFQYI